MPKFSLELDLDGYDSLEEEIEACKEFIYESLNMTASGVSNITYIPPQTVDIPRVLSNEETREIFSGDDRSHIAQRYEKGGW